MNVILSLGLSWVYHPGCLVVAISKYGSGLIEVVQSLPKYIQSPVTRARNFIGSSNYFCFAQSIGLFIVLVSFMYGLHVILATVGYFYVSYIFCIGRFSYFWYEYQVRVFSTKNSSLSQVCLILIWCPWERQHVLIRWFLFLCVLIYFSPLSPVLFSNLPIPTAWCPFSQVMFVFWSSMLNVCIARSRVTINVG